MALRGPVRPEVAAPFTRAEPTTSSFVIGVVVPMPILPALSIIIA